MQLLGIEVDPFNTVHFSNHTGYGKFEGTTQTARNFESVMDCMEKHDLVQYSHVLSGFARGSPPTN
jgi:pyridoxine kinase